MGALADVANERNRQIVEEEWGEDHDDFHSGGELAFAGAAYAVVDESPKLAVQLWPWAEEFWRPKDRRRNMVRAAALLLAEIDRLDRIAAALEAD